MPETTDELPRIINDGAIEQAATTSLKEHPANPRQGDVGAVADSIQRNGFFGAVIAQRSTHHVLAGNHRLKAARALGMDAVPTIWIDVDDEAAMRILLADNRTSDLGTYDDAQLGQLLEHLASTPDGLDGTGYDGDALDQILRDAADTDARKMPSTKDDELDELQERWATAPGQVWEIPSATHEGTHRLACGDSTDADTIERLMNGAKARTCYTDAPYGVSYESDTLGTIQNDELRGSALYDLLAGAFRQAAEHTTDDAAFYLWHASSTRTEFETAMEAAGLEERQYLIWAKEGFSLGRSDYHWQHEPCYYAQKKGQRAHFTSRRDQATVWRTPREADPADAQRLGAGIVLDLGDDNQAVTVLPGDNPGLPRVDATEAPIALAFDDAPSTLWEISRDRGQDYLHPTQKPAALAARAILNSSQHGDAVLDLFAGAGAVFEAAEEHRRTAYGCDLDPRFVAVTLQRLADLGLEPTLAD